MASSRSSSAVSIPFLYSLFFLYIEPVSTFAGFYYAFFRQREYMDMTMSHDLNILSSQDGSNVGVSTRESIVLNQLANMYLAFALNEGLVLRSTRDVHVWRVYLFVLLLADFGHLYSVVGAGGSELYWQFWKWNAMYWGNLGFVYVGASFRIAFLLGIGLGQKSNKLKQ
ncbi:uncharacterized protein K489DRAFT_383295 [Dissoconium aciculare CBS 342.82]|uniref:DUF7704 domain-containing protein n=1 Tax=Dissoconium aciculare CBS 342.82 TaxID=1314786 RepID=A0A6J3LWQ7_9PEZI|nr:uncharacterized protein K489DRAFT_383295 [Dissoconium aciculare CBS 342.82]KAF1819729.1 hypothetical protein K489DRAFT_383295 [Dissoconium aciculare CBS 342.82]